MNFGFHGNIPLNARFISTTSFNFLIFFVEKQLKTFDRGGTPSVYESFVIKGEKLPRALCPRNYKKRSTNCRSRKNNRSEHDQNVVLMRFKKRKNEANLLFLTPC